MENINYTTPEWCDVSRLYAYVLANTAASHVAKNKEDRQLAKKEAEGEISTILVNTSFIAEYGCKKSNIKSKVLADYSKAIIANDFEQINPNGFIADAIEQENMLLQKLVSCMAYLNLEFDRYMPYFLELETDEQLRFSMYNNSNKPYIGRNDVEYEPGSYVPVDKLAKDEDGNYVLDGLDIEELEQEIKQNFVESYLEANLNKTIEKLENNFNTIQRYMRLDYDVDKAENAQKTYTMNKFPKTIEEEGRSQFVEEHQYDLYNSLIGKNRETGEKFATTKMISNQIRNYIELCEDLSKELGHSTMDDKYSVIGVAVESTKNKIRLDEFNDFLTTQEVSDSEPEI